MALIVLTDSEPVLAIKTLLRRATYVLIPTSLLVIKYFPEIGRVTHRYTYDTMYQGVSLGGNGLATVCFVCGLFLVWQMLQPGATARRLEFSINGLLGVATGCY